MLLWYGAAAVATLAIVFGAVLPIARFNRDLKKPYKPTRKPDVAAAEKRLKELTPAKTGLSYLVIGTGGLGMDMLEALYRRGERNLAGFDLRPASGTLPEGSVRLISGDMTNLKDVEAATKGVDVVFHTAAIITYQHRLPSQWEISRKVNIEGTNNVIKACQTNGVKVLVYTSSSTVALGKRHRGTTVRSDETLPAVTDESEALTHYMRSKALAEKAVLAAASPTLRTLSIRPSSSIIGPRDKFILQAAFDKMQSEAIGFERALFDFTFVENITLGHLCAEARLHEGKCSGEAFLISNEEPTDFLDVFTRLHYYDPSKSLKYIKLPPLLVYTLASITEAMTRLGLKPPGDLGMLSYCVLDFASVSYVFSCDKAKRDLGYRPAFTLDEALVKSMNMHASLFPEKALAQKLKGKSA